MSTRNFRVEFLRQKSAEGWIDEKFLHNDRDCPTYEVVFRDSATGEHYAMEYYRDDNHGIDTFDGMNDDHTIDCYEVRKEEVTTYAWVRK